MGWCTTAMWQWGHAAARHVIELLMWVRLSVRGASS